jgi:hypothetical protein
MERNKKKGKMIKKNNEGISKMLKVLRDNGEYNRQYFYKRKPVQKVQKRIYVKIQDLKDKEIEIEKVWVKIELPGEVIIEKWVPKYSVHVISQIDGTETVLEKEIKRSFIILINPLKVKRNPFVRVYPKEGSYYEKKNQLPFGIPNYLFAMDPQDPNIKKEKVPEIEQYRIKEKNWKKKEWKDYTPNEKRQLLIEARLNLFPEEDKELTEALIQEKQKKAFLWPKIQKDLNEIVQLQSYLKFRYTQFEEQKKDQPEELRKIKKIIETYLKEQWAKKEAKWGSEWKKTLNRIETGTYFFPEIKREERKESWWMLKKDLSWKQKAVWQAYEWDYLLIPQEEGLFIQDLYLEVQLPLFQNLMQNLVPIKTKKKKALKGKKEVIINLLKKRQEIYLKIFEQYGGVFGWPVGIHKYSHLLKYLSNYRLLTFSHCCQNLHNTPLSPNWLNKDLGLTAPLSLKTYMKILQQIYIPEHPNQNIASFLKTIWDSFLNDNKAILYQENWKLLKNKASRSKNESKKKEINLEIIKKSKIETFGLYNQDFLKQTKKDIIEQKDQCFQFYSQFLNKTNLKKQGWLIPITFSTKLTSLKNKQILFFDENKEAYVYLKKWYKKEWTNPINPYTWNAFQLNPSLNKDRARTLGEVINKTNVYYEWEEGAVIKKKKGKTFKNIESSYWLNEKIFYTFTNLNYELEDEEEEEYLDFQPIKYFQHFDRTFHLNPSKILPLSKVQPTFFNEIYKEEYGQIQYVQPKIIKGISFDLFCLYWPFFNYAFNNNLQEISKITSFNKKKELTEQSKQLLEKKREKYQKYFNTPESTLPDDLNSGINLFNKDKVEETWFSPEEVDYIPPTEWIQTQKGSPVQYLWINKKKESLVHLQKQISYIPCIKKDCQSITLNGVVQENIERLYTFFGKVVNRQPLPNEKTKTVDYIFNANALKKEHLHFNQLTRKPFFTFKDKKINGNKLQMEAIERGTRIHFNLNDITLIKLKDYWKESITINYLNQKNRVEGKTTIKSKEEESFLKKVQGLGIVYMYNYNIKQTGELAQQFTEYQEYLDYLKKGQILFKRLEETTEYTKNQKKDILNGYVYYGLILEKTKYNVMGVQWIQQYHEQIQNYKLFKQLFFKKEDKTVQEKKKAISGGVIKTTEDWSWLPNLYILPKEFIFIFYYLNGKNWKNWVLIQQRLGYMFGSLEKKGEFFKKRKVVYGEKYIEIPSPILSEVLFSKKKKLNELFNLKNEQDLYNLKNLIYSHNFKYLDSWEFKAKWPYWLQDFHELKESKKITKNKLNLKDQELDYNKLFWILSDYEKTEISKEFYTVYKKRIYPNTGRLFRDLFVQEQLKLT